MTRLEFDAWLAWHGSLFPTVRKFLNEAGEALPIVLDAWFEALAHIKPERAKEITKRMVAGLAQHPNGFEIASLPAAIVAEAPPYIETIEEARRKAEGFHDTP